MSPFWKKNGQSFFEIEVNILPLFALISKNDCFGLYSLIDLNNIISSKHLIDISKFEFWAGQFVCLDLALMTPWLNYSKIVVQSDHLNH